MQGLDRGILTFQAVEQVDMTGRWRWYETEWRPHEDSESRSLGTATVRARLSSQTIPQIDPWHLRSITQERPGPFSRHKHDKIRASKYM